MKSHPEHISYGSQQLRIFRRAIRDGKTLEEACAATGDIISPAEGRVYIEKDRKNPPPPEAFELLGPQPKEKTMAKPKKVEEENGDIEGEYKRPDAKGAFKIYRDEIKPKIAHMATIKGDLSEPYKRIKDSCHYPRKVMDFLVALDDMEDAKRDHFLIALNDGLKELQLFLPSDLVTKAQGDEEGPVVPAGERKRPKLVTVDDDFEASEEEIAEQKSRPSTEKAKAKAESDAEKVDA